MEKKETLYVGEQSGQRSKKSHKKIVARVIDAFLMSLLLVTLSISGQIVYEYNRYRPFLVSGDSMYPFLNYDATRKEIATGTLEDKSSHDGDWGDYDNPAYSYTCDYGLLDDKDGFLNRISRFDIVVTYFDSDYSLEEQGLKSSLSHSPKIKRIYGFPGESLYFDKNGSFFLKENGASEFKEIPQHQSIVDDGHLKETNDGGDYGTEESPITLNEEEYFVVGDNRRVGKSRDSRSEGPIGRMHQSDSRYPSGSFYLRGKIVAITGKASLEVKYNAEGEKTIDYSLVYSSLLFPWAIKEL